MAISTAGEISYCSFAFAVHTYANSYLKKIVDRCFYPFRVPGILLFFEHKAEDAAPIFLFL